MSVAVLNPLQPLLDMLDREFPRAVVSEEQRQADIEADLRDIARQDFVARRTPELVRQYRMDDERLKSAARHAAAQFSTGMGLAFRHEDDAELGRLIRARMAVFLHDQASDAAEDEGYTMFPEVE